MKRMLIEEHHRQGGWALLDAVLALAVIAAMIPVIATYLSMSNDEMLKKAVSTQMEQVTDAAAQYIRNHYSVLKTSATATSAVSLNIANLTADKLLPATFSTKNAWGQTYIIWVTQPTSGNLQALVLTYGGRSYDPAHPKFGNILVPSAAVKMGARGGYVPTGTMPGQASTTVRGAFGGWTMNLIGTNIARPGAGHLAALVYFDQGQLASDYLYRVQVPGHSELNTMYTNLDMNGHTILMGNGQVGGGTGQGVSRINFENHNLGDFTCTATENDSGSVYFNDADGLYICRKGKKLHIADSLNSGFFQTASIEGNGAIVAKPSCPTGLPTPQIFLATSNFSTNGTGESMGAVQTWAVNLGASWRVNMRILDQSGWVSPAPGYGKLLVITKCS